MENVLSKIPTDQRDLYADEISKYLECLEKIEQLVKCQNSFRDGKCCNRVIIDGYEYGDDMDTIVSRINHFTKQNERSLLNNITI